VNLSQLIVRMKPPNAVERTHFKISKDCILKFYQSRREFLLGSASLTLSSLVVPGAGAHAAQVLQV
jgi:hypothetical protein